MTTPTMQLMSWAAAQGPDVTHDLANAITVAQELHKNDFRESGDPYITHPIAVALILAEHGADPATVVTAVLHDLDRVASADANASPERDMTLRAMFGDAVIDLLAEFVALDKYGYSTPPVTTDQRVLVIKVFNRLHNMRTICHLRPEKQQRKATHQRHCCAARPPTRPRSDR